MTSDEQFRFALSQEEKDYLKKIVHLAILQRFDPETSIPGPPSAKLEEQLGAFVTLKEDGQLRGCIGHILGDKPVWQTVREMAQQAAFHDPRFPPVSSEELDRIEVEISILSPLAECPDVNAVDPGRHGLFVQRGFHSGLLLPQVATEHGWDRETFLAQTCVKAGLPPNCWQSGKVTIYWFEAEVF
jgi:hypothetical protein